MRLIKTLIRLRGCAGWSESSLRAHTRRYVVLRCDPIIIQVEYYCTRLDVRLSFSVICKIRNFMCVSSVKSLKRLTFWPCNKRKQFINEWYDSFEHLRLSVCFHAHQLSSENMVNCKREGSTFIPSRENTFSEGRQKNFDIVTSHESIFSPF